MLLAIRLLTSVSRFPDSGVRPCGTVADTARETAASTEPADTPRPAATEVRLWPDPNWRTRSPAGMFSSWDTPLIAACMRPVAPPPPIRRLAPLQVAALTPRARPAPIALTSIPASRSGACKTAGAAAGRARPARAGVAGTFLSSTSAAGQGG